MKAFNSVMKSVAGNEGEKCNYTVRLDTYGCGCQHDCSYCYAKSLLSFRNLWNPERPSVADIDQIRRKIRKIRPGEIVRLGGMTDCFQPMEMIHRNTYKTIKALNRRRIGYLYYFDGKTMRKKDVPPGFRIGDSRAAALNNYTEWIKFQKYADKYL